MLSQRLRVYFTGKRSSSNFLWKGFFLMRDGIARLRSGFLDLLVKLKKPEKFEVTEISQKSFGKGILGKYYFFGEFGFFNFCVIGGLAQYFKKYPEHKIEIITYENYGKMLELAFPENVKAYYTDYKFDEIYRSCYNYKNRVFNMTLKKLGFKKNVAEDLLLITPGLPKTRVGTSGGYFFQMISPLKYPLKKKNGKFISIFPRFRKEFTLGNISEKTWNNVIELLLKFNYKVVMHAHGSETLKLKHKNLICTKNIYEQIAYLNNSDFCITPYSGTQFLAQNCDCDCFVILSKDPRQSYLFEIDKKGYNPFNNKFYCVKENEDYLSKLEEVLKKLKNESK